MGEAVLTSTPNLYMFEAKTSKIGIPLHSPVLLYESGVQRGIHYMDMFSWCQFHNRDAKLDIHIYMHTRAEDKWFVCSFLCMPRCKSQNSMS